MGWEPREGSAAAGPREVWTRPAPFQVCAFFGHTRPCPPLTPPHHPGAEPRRACRGVDLWPVTAGRSSSTSRSPGQRTTSSRAHRPYHRFPTCDCWALLKHTPFPWAAHDVPPCTAPEEAPPPANGSAPAIVWITPRISRLAPERLTPSAPVVWRGVLPQAWLAAQAAAQARVSRSVHPAERMT